MRQEFRAFLSVAAVGIGLSVASCGGEGGADGRTLSGEYFPQFPPGTMRYEIALTDKSWTFSADGQVTTHSAGGPRLWRYQVDGNEIRLTGANDRTQGERRLFTFGDNGCIWDGSGNASVDVLFCPGP